MSASKEIIKLLTKVSDYTHRNRRDVFCDWLGLAEHTLDALPRHMESARLTGKPAEDTPEAVERGTRPAPSGARPAHRATFLGLKFVNSKR